MTKLLVILYEDERLTETSYLEAAKHVAEADSDEKNKKALSHKRLVTWQGNIEHMIGTSS